MVDSGYDLTVKVSAGIANIQITGR